MPRLLFVLTTSQFVFGCFAFRATPLHKPLEFAALAFLFRLFHCVPACGGALFFRANVLCAFVRSLTAYYSAFAYAIQRRCRVWLFRVSCKHLCVNRLRLPLLLFCSAFFAASPLAVAHYFFARTPLRVRPFFDCLLSEVYVCVRLPCSSLFFTACFGAETKFFAVILFRPPCRKRALSVFFHKLSAFFHRKRKRR